jgi:hypothetical protein
MAAVGAVALVLAGTMAAPAEARRRSDAVIYANRAIDICFAGGGDPSVTEYSGAFYFTCVHESGAVTEMELTYDGYQD